jgi:hypothetical protein
MARLFSKPPREPAMGTLFRLAPPRPRGTVLDGVPLGWALPTPPYEVFDRPIYVRNAVGEHKCKCGSSLDHCKRFAGINPWGCSVFGCPEDADVGAHVVKWGILDQRLWLVPMCTWHNDQRDAVLKLRSHIRLVSTNVASTCGR